MTAPDKTDAGCTQCQRSAAQLAQLATAWWECSCVECPQRRRLTAAPPDEAGEPLGREGSGCWRVKPHWPEY